MRRAWLLVVLLIATVSPVMAEIPPLWMLTRSLPRPSAAAPMVPAVPGGMDPGSQCRAAIDAAERQAGIPPHLMAAIGRVESGRRNAGGQVDPWPWSIDADGVDHVYPTKAEAIAAVRALRAAGAHSIDVGCMQVSLLFHPDAFASLDDAFDPMRNAAYAARFLMQLRTQTGNWATATAWYHSATPELGADYQRRVMAVLPEEQQRPSATPVSVRSAPRGAFMLSNGAAKARFLPMAPGAQGRTLAAYRAAPVLPASRMTLR